MKPAAATILTAAALWAAAASPAAEDSERSEAEERFISELRSRPHSIVTDAHIDTDTLVPLGTDMYVLPGDTYLHPGITSTAYVRAADARPVWDSEKPCESIANLFILTPMEGGSVPMEITVMLHEYGARDTVKTDVATFMAMCRAHGCKPYWGVEKWADGTLEGSLFLYNAAGSYDHTLKITCRPDEVIAGRDTVRARAGLFIPTGNVHNLTEPYRTKTDNEKIRYDNQ